jgi:hypothetical protein
MLCGWWGGGQRINRCGTVCAEEEGGYSSCFNGAAGERWGVAMATVGAFQRDCVAARGDSFIIASLQAALVAAFVHVSGVTTRADRAGRVTSLQS